MTREEYGRPEQMVKMLWQSKEAVAKYMAKHYHRKHNIPTSFVFRQEAKDKSLANAKVCAKCWRHFLHHTDVHIRRGYIVTAKVENFGDFMRLAKFSYQVNNSK